MVCDLGACLILTEGRWLPECLARETIHPGTAKWKVSMQIKHSQPEAKLWCFASWGWGKDTWEVEICSFYRKHPGQTASGRIVFSFLSVLILLQLWPSTLWYSHNLFETFFLVSESESFVLKPKNSHNKPSLLAGGLWWHTSPRFTVFSQLLSCFSLTNSGES